MKVAVLYAVEREGALFKEWLHATTLATNTSLSTNNAISSARLNCLELILLQTGVGKVNAAASLALAIEHYKPALVISTGICGAFPTSGLKNGDVAIATSDTYADEGLLSEDGFHTMDFIGIPLLQVSDVKYYNKFDFDLGYTQMLESSLRSSHVPCGISLGMGGFITVSTCTGSNQKARWLESVFNPICESMEGASVAHVCTLLQTPAIEIRGVSNTVETRNLRNWDIDGAIRNVTTSVITFLKTIDY